LINNFVLNKEEDWKTSLKRRIALADFVSLSFSLLLILSLRFPEIWIGEFTQNEIRNTGLSILVLIFWLFYLWINGSRKINVLGFGADEYKKIINATLLSFTSVAFTSYIFKLEISRLFVLTVFPFGLLLLFISRRLLRKSLLKARNSGRYLSKVLLLHSGDSDPVELRLKIAQHAGFNIICKMSVGRQEEFNVEQVVQNAIKNNCNQIIIGQTALISASDLRQLGWALEGTQIDLIVAPAVTEIAGPRLKVSNVEGLPLLHLEQPTFSGISIFTKRIVDVTLSLIFLIVFSPVLLISALAIKFYDRGSIFYLQKRIGQNNREFTVYKFRTMHEGSHEHREEVMSYTNKDPRLAKNPFDPRITKPGLFLRRWSIDEIPQIINVLKGEMSLVGPRPPLVEEVNKYEKSDKRRLLVKPGLTGLWQVSGRSELDWEDAVRLDLYYVENWSLTLDILIIIRTAAAVWRGEGAY
jgi:exopolysaccharide biosynthesis polyprenyl glycosylphosphotransferase